MKLTNGWTVDKKGYVHSDHELPIFEQMRREHNARILHERRVTRRQKMNPFMGLYDDHTEDIRTTLEQFRDSVLNALDPFTKSAFTEQVVKISKDGLCLLNKCVQQSKKLILQIPGLKK